MNRTDENTKIIERIEYVRKYLGLNKSRVSIEIGLKPQTYNNFIGAQASKPSVDLIAGVCSRFGVNANWLFGMEEGPVFRDGRQAVIASGPVPVPTFPPTLEQRVTLLEKRVLGADPIILPPVGNVIHRGTVS